jgi:hypothetical protein
MDGETAEQLIISKLDEQSQAIGELVKAVNAIDKLLVGRDKCDIFRREFDDRLKILENCRPTTVSEKELQSVKEELDNRIKITEEELKPLKWTWGMIANNKVVAPMFAGGGFIIVEILWGRIRDYGIHEVALSVGVYLVALLLLYFASRKRDSIKMMFHW